MNQEDIQATQGHAILNVLLNHCGKGLTPDVIDAIRSELQHEMHHGPCAWAFLYTTPPAPAQACDHDWQYIGSKRQSMWECTKCGIYKVPDEQPAPAQPLTDEVCVPLEVLEAAESSLGSFCSDQGWSDQDMQNMDNLSAYIARHKAAHGITSGKATEKGGAA